ncbi:MAG: hypothetical protein WAL80_19570 [Xanthobacteraceae bacterium]
MFKSYDFLPAAKTTGTANGLSFQIDRVVPGSKIDAQGDFNEILAGYGFLMRRSLLQLTGADPARRTSWTPYYNPANDPANNPEAWRLLNAIQGAPSPWPLISVDDPANSGQKIKQPDKPEQPDQRFKVATATSPVELLAPTPIASVAGMPRVNFQYNNAPPAGSSGTSQVTHSTTSEMADGAPSVFHLIQPIASENPPPRQLLPFLAYGLSYDLLIFAITNQGAVPEELRDSTTTPPSPVTVRADLKPAESLGADFANLVRSARYLRTTSVGHLGFDTNVINVKDISNPSGYDAFKIPKDVNLVAAEIDGLMRAGVRQYLVAPSPATSAPSASGALNSAVSPIDGRKACLLLSAPTSRSGPKWTADSRKFTIAAPACPFEVLDRWLARDEYKPINGVPSDSIRKLRSRVRALYALAAAQQQANPKSGLDPAKLDDPAVAGLVVTTQLFRRGGQSKSGSVNSMFVPWPSVFDGYTQTNPPPALPQDLKVFQRQPVTITFSAQSGTQSGDTVGLVQTPGSSNVGPTITVTASAGDVVLVTFHAAVSADYFQIDTGAGRFDPIVLKDPEALFRPIVAAERLAIMGPPPAAPSQRYMLFDPVEVVIEAAQPYLPDAGDIYKACFFRSRPAGARQILFDWNGANQQGVTWTAAEAVKWDAVGSIETGDIAWSFTGRPVTRFPFEAAKDEPPGSLDSPPTAQDTSATNPLLWDIEAYADRATLAPAVKVFAVPLLAPGQTATIPLQDLPSPGPAGIRRFEIVARNRYAAAYQQIANSGVAANVLAKTTYPLTGSSLRWVDGYRRVLVKAVPPDPVPKPSIRALVPLTRSMDDAAGPAVAGLLVVLDGAFGDIGGVAEWLDVGAETIEQKIPVQSFATNKQPADAVLLPSTDARTPPKYLLQRAQIGADPLIRTYPRGNAPNATREGYRFMPLQVTGPLGHTFDTAAAVARFNATSFVVEPPQITASDPGAWWMAKLKLRRTVLAEGIAAREAVTVPASAVSMTLPTSSTTAAPQGYPDQWSFNLVDLSLGAQQTAIQTMGVSAQRMSNGKLLPGGTDQIFICWAKTVDPKNQSYLAIWLAPNDPNTIADPAWHVAPDEAWRIPNPNNAATVGVSLRLTFSPKTRRILDPNDGSKYQIVLSYDASLEVRSTDNWIFVGDYAWWGDTKSYLDDGTYESRLQVTLSWPTGLLQSAQQSFVCVAPQASDWVGSHWGQFLPEANRVANISLKEDGALNLVGDQLQLQFKGMSWWLSTSALAGNVQKDNQGLFHLVMISRRIRSASGRESEAYLGLYYDHGKAPTASGQLALVPFGAAPAAPEPLIAGASDSLRWRLLTVRTTKPKLDLTAALNGTGDYASDANSNPWRLFFPSENDEGINVVPAQPSDATLKPRDALLQILEISGWQPVKSAG